ncbi:hypothetical protein ACCK16_00040 [Staphylococcus aureus]
METLNSINIPKRKEDSHKGDYGKILLIGGSANYGRLYHYGNVKFY